MGHHRGTGERENRPGSAGGYGQGDRRIKVDEGAILEYWLGVPHGSVIGPLLWNIFYDDVLSLGLPTDCQLVAYADDLALVARGTKVVEEKGKEKLRPYLCIWLDNSPYS